MDDHFDNVFRPLYNSYKNIQNLEFEMRLGKINNTYFDSNVGKENFFKILDVLNKFPSWEEIKQSNTSVYYTGSMRTIVDDDTEETTVICKTRVCDKNIRLMKHPLDLRLSVSTEKPAEYMETAESIRIKKRTSFIRKNLSIDMTIVTGDQEDLDSDTPESYEVELEIINPYKIKTEEELFNLFYKVECILKILSE
jgi:hypothetical protein